MSLLELCRGSSAGPEQDSTSTSAALHLLLVSFQDMVAAGGVFGLKEYLAGGAVEVQMCSGCRPEECTAVQDRATGV